MLTLRQIVLDKMCQLLHENERWSRMSVLLTPKQAVKSEMERNQVKQTDSPGALYVKEFFNGDLFRELHKVD